MADLHALLDAERHAIRSGEFDALSRLADQKEALLLKLGDSHFDETALAAVKAKAERNAGLLEAAQRGFGAALTQIGSAHAAAVPKTYGPKGTRDALGPGHSRVHKRC